MTELATEIPMEPDTAQLTFPYEGWEGSVEDIVVDQLMAERFYLKPRRVTEIGDIVLTRVVIDRTEEPFITSQDDLSEEVIDILRYRAMLAGYGTNDRQAPLHNALWDEIWESTWSGRPYDSSRIRRAVSTEVLEARLRADFAHGREFKEMGWLFDYTIDDESEGDT